MSLLLMNLNGFFVFVDLETDSNVGPGVISFELLWMVSPRPRTTRSGLHSSHISGMHWFALEEPNLKQWGSEGGRSHNSEVKLMVASN
jgi:hypothetical protein